MYYVNIQILASLILHKLNAKITCFKLRKKKRRKMIIRKFEQNGEIMRKNGMS